MRRLTREWEEDWKDRKGSRKRKPFTPLPRLAASHRGPRSNPRHDAIRNKCDRHKLQNTVKIPRNRHSSRHLESGAGDRQLVSTRDLIAVAHV
ncbi:hypothetical protein E2C01_069334 [Portunus trituberculatus]|uniref:Uncharacterized protein n=1 Tax=Portunus trituberculatus TaxID=210409 RepID=A0A5B7HPS8_PORTR|nr:hypothetical protein [Portunus trituberculatus]